ncbi:uncharacterized protein LOC132035054 [Lycium ferocissimum]|uniref:uncharacterized protein LOC132035054 n=1 Tax=Lycium ferocissimum TaxID=112874 RepID=UPI0028154C22|nr:uncharacterized protein LOC132035054 [Lycium ferocissimum]
METLIMEATTEIRVELQKKHEVYQARLDSFKSRLVTREQTALGGESVSLRMQGTTTAPVPTPRATLPSIIPVMDLMESEEEDDDKSLVWDKGKRVRETYVDPVELAKRLKKTEVKDIHQAILESLVEPHRRSAESSSKPLDEIEEVDRLLNLVGNPPEGIPQEQYYEENFSEEVRKLVINYISLEKRPETPREGALEEGNSNQGAESGPWIMESDPQEESEPQEEAFEPQEAEEEQPEEVEPQDMEQEESEPVDIEVEEDQEPFGMFPEFQEEANDANDESDYYALLIRDLISMHPHLSRCQLPPPWH